MIFSVSSLWTSQRMLVRLSCKWFSRMSSLFLKTRKPDLCYNNERGIASGFTELRHVYTWCIIYLITILLSICINNPRSHCYLFGNDVSDNLQNVIILFLFNSIEVLHSHLQHYYTVSQHVTSSGVSQFVCLYQHVKCTQIIPCSRSLVACWTTRCLKGLLPFNPVAYT
jgi:hypothetical protein